MSDGTGAIPDQPPLLPIKIPMTPSLPPRLLKKQEDRPTKTRLKGGFNRREFQRGENYISRWEKQPAALRLERLSVEPERRHV